MSCVLDNLHNILTIYKLIKGIFVIAQQNYILFETF